MNVARWGLSPLQLTRWCYNHHVPLPAAKGKPKLRTTIGRTDGSQDGTIQEPALPDRTVAADETIHQKPFVAALREVIEELARARRAFAPMHSAHEGWAVLYEEVCELWEAVRANDRPQQRLEAVQVAAMAMRMLIDVLPDVGR